MQRRQFTVKAKSHTPQRSALLLCQTVAATLLQGGDHQEVLSYSTVTAASFILPSKFAAAEKIKEIHVLKLSPLQSAPLFVPSMKQ